PELAKVLHLRARAYVAVLYLAEAAERYVIFEYGPGPDPAVGANGNARADRCALDHRPPDARFRSDPRVDDLRARPYDRPLRHDGLTTEVALRMNDSVRRDDDRLLDER